MAFTGQLGAYGRLKGGIGGLWSRFTGIMQSAGFSVPPFSDLLAWLRGNDGSAGLDYLDYVTDFEVVDRPCLDMDGLDYITVPGLSVTDKVTLVGWEFGEELVTNGDFANGSTGWTLGGGWSVSNGVLTASPATSGTSQRIGYDSGVTFAFGLDVVEVNSGTLVPALSGGVAGTSITSAGSYFNVLTSVSSDGRIFLSSTTLNGSVDNVSVKEITLNDSTAIPTVTSNTISFTAGTVAGILINDELVYTCEEGAGATLYSISENWDDATIVSPTAGIATVRSGTCDEASWNAQYGYTLSGSVYIPALADGSADATGGAIQVPGGYVHNGGGYSLKATDSVFTSGTPSFWSADGATADAKTYEDLIAHISFDYGMLIQYEKVNGYCMVRELVQYVLDKAFTVPEYLLLVLWAELYTAQCGAGHLIPFEVVAGTGIGPDSGWFTGDGTHILLVEDA